MPDASKTVSFEKVHACGNDFLLLQEDPGPQVRAAMCDRHHGLGADGVLVFTGRDEACVCVHHWDPDGADSFCLNGLRAVLACLHQKGDIPAQGSVFTEGVRLPYRMGVQGACVWLDLPSVQPWEGGPLYDGLHGFQVQVGNPQLVLCADQVSETRFRQLAPGLRWDHQFPEGTNVTFSKEVGPNKIHSFTYERGVEGFTLACGTGMLAAAAVFFACHKAARLEVQTLGRGNVLIQKEKDKVLFQGETAWVASGVWRCGH